MKSAQYMSLREVSSAQKANDRALTALYTKRMKGGRNRGATQAAIDRRRIYLVELADRRRELLRSSNGARAYIPLGG